MKRRSIRVSRRCPSHEDYLKWKFIAQISEFGQQFQLLLARADNTHIDNTRGAISPFGSGRTGEKKLLKCIRDKPSLWSQRSDEGIHVRRDADHTADAAQGKGLEMLGKPIVSVPVLATKFVDCPHDAVNGHHGGKSGQCGADCAFTLGALAVHNIGFEFA